MDYPLLLGGEERGRLKVEKQGLYTLMEARAPGARGLVRLWVRGGGEETYLGLMEPREEGLYLSRRLSRLELAAFPAPIELATDRRLEEEVYITNEPRREEPERGGEEPAPEEESREHVPGGAAAIDSGEAKAEEPEGEAAEAEKAEDMKETAEPEAQNRDSAGELLWTARRDGSLIARRGERYLVALPARLRSVPPGARLRRIGGREYLLFFY